MVSNNAKFKTAQNCTANALIVDSDRDSIRTVLSILAGRGICGTVASDNNSTLTFIENNSCDLVLIAITNSGSSQGLALVKQIKINNPELPIIMLGQESNNTQQVLNTAVKAINLGCCDCLIKPLDRKKIEALLDTLLPNKSVSTADIAANGAKNIYRIIGKSIKLTQGINLAKKIAPTDIPVLIGGQSGTGKELFSYLIHHNSKRSHGPYIRVNCAALNDSLLESELFGHEKGAFTGACTQRKGRFEMAHGGTLLLDEITETSPQFQAKLLRVIEQQDFERLGGNDSIRVNVRIISTTNKDMLQQIQLGNFREDLYYRLSGARLIIPSLSQRKEDMPELIWHFINLYAKQSQRKIAELSGEMMDIFEKYHWPGNIRQLRNVVRTSLLLGTGPILSLADVSWLFDELQPLPQENNISITEQNAPAIELAGTPLALIERQAILETLEHTNGNQTKAAKLLGISDRTLRDKVRRYKEQKQLQPA